MQIPHDVETILRLFGNNGYEAYIVGGCVRDSLLNKEPHDWDICTSATPEQMIELADRNQIRYIPTGLKHGTITLELGDGLYEVTTFRIDGEYTDGRHPDNVEFTSDINKDLARRDFTINAMAYNSKKGLIDPFNGKRDLENKTLRCVGNPYERFKEDGLRILRALRFSSTYSLEIEGNTSKAAHDLKGLLAGISAERIQTELVKLLAGENKGAVLLDYADIIAYIIPELEPTIGYEQHNKHHVYTIYEHIVKAVEAYRGNDKVINIALLLHDVGKPDTFQLINGNGHFYGHAKLSVEKAKQILSRLRFGTKDTEDILKLIKYHDVDYSPNRNIARRLLSKLGEEQLTRLITVIRCDVLAQSSYMQKEKLSNLEQFEIKVADVIKSEGRLRITDLAISGRDIITLGAKEGPIVGKILHELFNMVLDGKLDNKNSVLLTTAAQLLANYREGEQL